jgi:hypothetical protein
VRCSLHPPSARINTITDTTIATDETNRLIASNKVEGTSVYNQQDEKLGSI